MDENNNLIINFLREVPATISVDLSPTESQWMSA